MESEFPGDIIIMSKIHAPTKFLEISCSCLKGVVFLLLYLIYVQHSNLKKTEIQRMILE